MKTIKAGPYTLVARSIDGGYRGVLWSDGEKVVDIREDTLAAVWATLCDELYERQISAAAARVNQPTAAEIAKIFLNIGYQLTAGHKAMLKAHLNASDRRITARQLAKAAGYANYSAANLQYGLLGAMLFAEMPIDLPKRKDGSAVMTCTIAEGDDLRGPEDEWIWEMRPYVAEGLLASRIL
ncbi:hypothetical protein [Burkholderia sp. THE68]|uniref:hypothetical protein n=1 Tax=Burkholderia sp. THE68 TaxID=758782 RepID=UPI001389BDF4|nr:hypothetical protein [Burkholderia sp. THE68]